MIEPTPQELQAAGELYEQLAGALVESPARHTVLPIIAWRDKLGAILLLNKPKVVRSIGNKISVRAHDVVGEEFKITLHGTLARKVRAQIDAMNRDR